MTKARNCLIALLAGVTMLAPATAAAKRIEVVEANGGVARLIIKEKGYSLQARDTVKDGHGVVAYVYTKGRRDAAYEIKDTNGADNGWAKTTIPAGALGRDVLLRVVVKDHNNSTRQGVNHLQDDKHKRLRLG